MTNFDLFEDRVFETAIITITKSGFYQEVEIQVALAWEMR